MLVCWSGGCDSTWVLYDLATYATAKEPVRAISFTHPQVTCSEEEKKARKRILALLKSRGLPIQAVEIAIQVSGPFEIAADRGIPQPLLWLNAVNYLGKNEDLYTGYIKNDVLWHYRSEYHAIFSAMQRIKDATGNLIHRLEWENKSRVFKWLIEAGLYDLCSYCEMPLKGNPCKICDSCRAHKAALEEMNQAQLSNAEIGEQRKAKKRRRM